MDPQQEIFTRIRKDLLKLGYDVYDCGLPPEGTLYPFVYLGDVQEIDTSAKAEIMGNAGITIHVWGNNPEKRGDISQMLANIKSTCRRIEATDNYSWLLSGLTQRIFPDNTTKEPLIHGVIEANFRFT